MQVEMSTADADAERRRAFARYRAVRGCGKDVLASLVVSCLSACGLRTPVDQPDCGDGRVEPGDICHFEGPHSSLESTSDVFIVYHEIADVTADGIDDFLWFAGGLMTFAGKGDGTFEHVATSDYEGGHHEMFEEDGLLHMVGAGSVDDEAEIRAFLSVGDGSGAFAEGESAPVAAGQHVHDVAVGDFDGDGGWELAVWSREPYSIHVIPFDTTGFGEPRRIEDEEPGCDDWYLYVGDFDADGASDLMCLSYGRGIEVRYGGRLEDPVYAPMGAAWLSAIADMDGDGADDVLGLGHADDDPEQPMQVWTLWGAPGQGLGDSTWTPVPCSALEVVPGDFDLDGVMDLAALVNEHRVGGPGTLVLMRGDDHGDFREVSRFRGGGLIRLGHFNHDAVLDLVTMYVSDGSYNALVVKTVLSDP
jgi:hypothetical protein